MKLKIGDLSAATETSVQTIRYYEKQGLLAPPQRSEGNFRMYGADALDRLRFIRHCRGLDMSLDEVRVLLRVMDSPDDDCGDVNALLDAHIGHVSQRLRELRALERQLKALRQRCLAAQDARHCGILAQIAQEAGQSKAAVAGPVAGHLGSVHGKA